MKTKMVFDEQQSNVNIVELPNGMYDVTVLENETIITRHDEQSDTIYQGYEYDGNKFRTVYKLSEEDINADVEKYLNYSSEGEPSLKQLKHDEDVIDAFTLQLMEEGVI
jgi:hypothetical protein